MCGGRSSRILRHNRIRDMIARAARDVGYKTDLEHGGGLGDKRRPGDMIIYNWCSNKHLLIDVAVTNPLAPSHINQLLQHGAGSVANEVQTAKRDKYKNLDPNICDFLPLIVETCGGVGSEANSFCKELKKRLCL